MKKKILFITPDLRYGGTNSSLSNIYSTLKDKYEIDIYALYNKQIGNYSFKNRVLKSGKLIYWCYSYYSDLTGWDRVGALWVKLILRLCHILNVDLKGYLQKKEVGKISRQKHYNIIIGFQEGAATQFASRFKDIKKMAWIHCDYARYHHITGQDEKNIYGIYDRIVCVSKYTLSTFIDIYPSLKEKVVSIYNLYDQNRVQLLSKEPCSDLRFDTSVFSILSVGRIDSVKRFSYIPNIAKRLLDAGKVFKWFIIGNVVEEEEYNHLRQNIINYHLENIVVILGGMPNPYPFFAQSCLFVTTSSSEACPIVFLEAQTFNLPIVTTDFGSSYEFIEHGTNGYISSLENMHKYIIEIMDGHLQYKHKYFILNDVIQTQLDKEISVVMENN